MFAALSDVVWTVGTGLVLVALLVLAKRIDPHWVAKDGRAFTCKIQPIRASGRTEGRWRDARAVVRDGEVSLVQRGLGAAKLQPFESHRVVGRSDTPPPRTAVFLLDGDPMWALRVPAGSKAVLVLESLVDPPGGG